MLYLAATGSNIDALEGLKTHENVGIMTSPLASNYTALETGRRWASDCDALTSRPGKAHNVEKYLTHLEKLEKHAERCLFIVVPDMPGDAQGTLANFYHYARLLAETPFPLAYCMQDGAEYFEIPDAAQVAFLGGTDPWRRRWGASMLRRARAQGMRTHVGRVNSKRRMQALRVTECDSADGTHLSFNGVLGGLREVNGWLNAVNDNVLFEPVDIRSELTPYEQYGEAAEDMFFSRSA